MSSARRKREASSPAREPSERIRDIKRAKSIEPAQEAKIATPVLRRTRSVSVADPAGKKIASRPRGRKSALPLLNSLPPPLSYSSILQTLTFRYWGNVDVGQAGLGVANLRYAPYPTKHSNANLIYEDVACGPLHTLWLDHAGRVWSFGISELLLIFLEGLG